MRRVILTVMFVCAVTSLAFAADASATSAATAAETVTLTGTIIDNMCADSNKADLANFVLTHTKECALMPGCAESGFSIFADGKLYKFDKDSNAKVSEFLKKEDGNLQVVVTAKKAGEELSLVSIENQK